MYIQNRQVHSTLAYCQRKMKRNPFIIMYACSSLHTVSEKNILSVVNLHHYCNLHVCPSFYLSVSHTHCLFNVLRCRCVQFLYSLYDIYLVKTPQCVKHTTHKTLKDAKESVSPAASNCVTGCFKKSIVFCNAILKEVKLDAFSFHNFILKRLKC